MLDFKSNPNRKPPQNLMQRFSLHILYDFSGQGQKVKSKYSASDR